MIMDALIEAILSKRNPTAVGLDTQLVHLPPSFLAAQGGAASLSDAARAIAAFNRALIDAVADIVPCVKVQAAYYEALGPGGMQAFADTLAYASKRGLFTIADGKRNDIASTASAYAEAFLGQTHIGGTSARAFPADMLTVNPYLGADGIAPFLKEAAAHDRAIFALVKTSNPSSAQLQDLVLEDGRLLYEAVGDLVAEWNGSSLGAYGFGRCGAVVGATHPAEQTRLRARLPHVFFLIPGYGAQGATADDLTGSFDARGLGGVVNASRSILAAWRAAGTEDAAGAARDAAIAMRDDLRDALKRAGKSI